MTHAIHSIYINSTTILILSLYFIVLVALFRTLYNLSIYLYIKSFPPIQEGDQDQTVQGFKRHNIPTPPTALSLTGDKIQSRRFPILLALVFPNFLHICVLYCICFPIWWLSLILRANYTGCPYSLSLISEIYYKQTMLGRGIRFSIISTTMSKVLFTLLINLTCAPFVSRSTSKQNWVSRQVFSNISVANVARAAVILVFKVPTLGTGVLYTLSLQKSRVVMSGARGGHFVGPSLPIQRFGKVTS